MKHKRFISAAVCLCTVTALAANSFSVMGSGAVAGDANGDGAFNVADLVFVRKYIMGNGELSLSSAADLNEDGAVDSFDFALIRKSLTEKFPDNDYAFTFTAENLCDIYSSESTQGKASDEEFILSQTEFALELLRNTTDGTENTDIHLVSVDGNELGTNDMQMLYASGNMMVDTDGTVLVSADADEWESGKAVCGERNATEADVRSDEPFFESYVKTETAVEAFESVLEHAGAGGTTGRDYIDSRYVTEAASGTVTYTGSKSGFMGFPNSLADVGGLPTEENFVHSTGGATNAENDTDRDGMPNVWEQAHGLNPDDASDGNIVSLSDEDYTNVEMYLNELIGDPVIYKTEVEGDVNADGEFNIADAVMMQKYILSSGKLYNYQVGDLSSDGSIDVFDLVAMRRKLMKM